MFTMCQLKLFNNSGSASAQVDDIISVVPVSVSTVTLSVPTTITNLALRTNRKRLQKRHYNYISFRQRFQSELGIYGFALDWGNPCSGNWTGPNYKSIIILKPHKRCGKHKKLLRILKKNIASELRQLKNDNTMRNTVISIAAPVTSLNQAIDLKMRAAWITHAAQYKFLPRLNKSLNHLSLRRIHHDLQFYVASFSYLRHVQLHWDHENLQKQSVLSTELFRYRDSSRTVLCLVEEAINATNRLYSHNQWMIKQRQRFKTIPRELMERRLQKYKTPLVELHNQAVLAAGNQHSALPHQPHQLDTLFLKYQYIAYLKHLTQLLTKLRMMMCTRKNGI